jgi:short-subunit dehydrogenase
MPRSLANQVAVITGASSGIGWALAKELAAAGARVGLIARRRDRLDELAEEIRHGGGRAAVAPADVTDRRHVELAIQSITDQLGPIQLLVANAGLGIPTLRDPVNVDDVEQMFRVNVLGAIYAISAVLPGMLEQGRGHLAAISSLAGYKGLPGESGYCATKAALNTYMEGLRIHLRDRRIRVTTICPGFVRTAMTDVMDCPMPFVMEADEAARLIVRALQDRRKVCNFPWQMAWLMKLVRWLPDWALAYSLKDYNQSPPMAKAA